MRTKSPKGEGVPNILTRLLGNKTPPVAEDPCLSPEGASMRSSEASIKDNSPSLIPNQLRRKSGICGKVLVHCGRGSGPALGPMHTYHTENNPREGHIEECI
jgi:hypothetical protein